MSHYLSQPGISQRFKPRCPVLRRFMDSRDRQAAGAQIFDAGLMAAKRQIAITGDAVRRSVPQSVKSDAMFTAEEAEERRGKGKATCSLVVFSASALLCALCGELSTLVSRRRATCGRRPDVRFWGNQTGTAAYFQTAADRLKWRDAEDGPHRSWWNRVPWAESGRGAQKA